MDTFILCLVEGKCVEQMIALFGLLYQWIPCLKHTQMFPSPASHKTYHIVILLCTSAKSTPHLNHFQNSVQFGQVLPVSGLKLLVTISLQKEVGCFNHRVVVYSHFVNSHFVNSHLVNSHLVNGNKVGIDKVGIDEVGSRRSGKVYHFIHFLPLL